MSAIDPKTLVGLLSPTCERALREALLQVVVQRRFVVEVEDLILALLAADAGDVPALLTRHGVDPAPVKVALERALEECRVGNAGKPTFGLQLLALLEQAWTAVSAELGYDKIRGGALLVALARHPEAFGASSWVETLSGVPNLARYPLASLEDSSESAEAGPGAATVATIERQLGNLAGEAFARLRLEPEGYQRVAIAWVPFAGFDFIYARGNEVVLVDTVAGDEVLQGLHTPNGEVLMPGDVMYVLAVVENMRRVRPDVANAVFWALERGDLRYYEVRQPIDGAGALGDIEVREFAL
jgi:hypothetical protein